jgi:hypothetical protein
MSNSVASFITLVSQLPTNDNGCVLWTRALALDGYGNYKIKGNRELAHRLSYRVFKGKIPSGCCVLHKCDNPACVNVDHLFLGTRNINNKDRASKGRSAVGERSGRAKLKAAQVLKIYKLYHAGGVTTTELGQRFGVSNHQISMIGLKQTWRHIL